MSEPIQDPMNRYLTNLKLWAIGLGATILAGAAMSLTNRVLGPVPSLPTNLPPQPQPPVVVVMGNQPIPVSTTLTK